MASFFISSEIFLLRDLYAEQAQMLIMFAFILSILFFQMLLNNLTGDKCLSAGAGDVMDEWPWVCRTPETSLKVEGWENYIHMS